MSESIQSSPSRSPLPCEPAICYSGYRAGQRPGQELPSEQHIREDLLLLHSQGWRLLRLYDCGPHALRTLQAIRDLGLDLQVLLGAYLEGEIDNPRCPWGGRYDAGTLARHRELNDAEVDRLVRLVGSNRDIVAAAAVGNEACVDWTDHLVCPTRVRELLRRVRARIDVPLTVCDNYVPWLGEMGDVLGSEVDFVSIHSYPVWEGRALEQALQYTQENHQAVVRRFAGMQVAITEAGWPTTANDRGIDAWRADEQAQSHYVQALLDWSGAQRVPCFVFEAFDEAWKGSEDPREPEKHWGLYTEARTPKRFAAQSSPRRDPR